MTNRTTVRYEWDGVHIAKIEHLPDEEVTEELWIEIISVVRDDREDCLLKHIQICNPDVPSPCRYLQVLSGGHVDMHGTMKSPATVFTLRQWEGCPTQFICEGGDCKNYVLYMDHGQLKARHHTGDSDVDPKTIFLTDYRNGGISIESKSERGHYIRFSKNGRYIQPGMDKDNVDKTESFPQIFKPKVITRVTSV